METLLITSMAMHFGAFLWWAIAGVYTRNRLEAEYQQKRAQLEREYEDSRSILDSEIKNVRRMAHEANLAFVQNVSRGGE